MTKDPACGTGAALPDARLNLRTFADMYDDTLAIQNLVHASRLLGWELNGLTETGCPPILFLLDEAFDRIRRLSGDISELEKLANHGRATVCP